LRFKMKFRQKLKLLATALLASIAYQTPALSEELTIGYQTVVEPSKLADRYLPSPICRW